MTVHYEITLLNKAFTSGDFSLPNSVRIVELQNQTKVREYDLGVLETEDLYRLIDSKSPIDFENIYVRDFSLREYRRLRKIAEDAVVEIGPWKTSRCFFDCGSHIDFTYSNFTGGANFEESIFYHGTLDFTHAKLCGPINDFSHCHFGSHKVLFQYAEFLGRETNFEQSVFTAIYVSFINAALLTELENFKRVHFMSGKVKFHFADFGDGLKTFEKMKFHGSLFDFRRVNWGKGKVDFRRAVFTSAHVTFEEMVMTGGKMTFRMARFEGGDLTFRRGDFGPDEINFDYVKFGSQAINFDGCTLGKLSMMNTEVRSSLDLRLKSGNEIDLSSAYLYGVTDLNFERKDTIKTLVLYRTRNLGKIVIHWDRNNVRQLISDQNFPDSYKAEQFNLIKDNFARNGQYTDEDKAYVCFKRYEHKVLRRHYYKKLGSWGFLSSIYFHYRKIVFDRLGLFATSPGRVLLSMGIIISGFATMFLLTELLGWGSIVNAITLSDHLGLVSRSFYHSAITFFTVGYGDTLPTGFSRILSALEGWIGVFLMAYFTVAFVRKALR